MRPDTHLGQLAELVGVQQQLLQAAGVAVDLLGDVEQRAVALVDGLHMTVAPPQGDAVEHRRPRRPVPSRGDPGSEPDARRLRSASCPLSTRWLPCSLSASRQASRAQMRPGTSGGSPSRVPAPPPANHCVPSHPVVAPPGQLLPR